MYLVRELIIYGSTIISGSIGIIFLITLVYDNIRKKKVKKNKELEYEWKYPLDTNIEHIEEKEDNIKNGVVEEETPDGKVIMKYNDDSETFDYWGPKVIQYKYLETVAKKYVIMFDRKEVIVNIFKELYDAWLKNEKLNKEKEELNNEIIENQQDNPFASLKTYNSGTMGSTNKENKPKNSFNIVNQKSNRYSHKGKYDEYFDSIKVKEVKLYNDVDWKDWKKKC